MSSSAGSDGSVLASRKSDLAPMIGEVLRSAGVENAVRVGGRNERHENGTAHRIAVGQCDTLTLGEYAPQGLQIHGMHRGSGGLL